MDAADGMLMRVRLPGGAITPAGIQTVADVAERFGSGTVEFTSRANLQIRGLAQAAVPTAAAHLVRHGLADADPARDARRDVVGPPLAGHDPTELADVGAAVADVARLLAAAPGLDGLPPKFCVVLDGGGVASVRGVPADVALGAVRTVEGDIVVQLELGRPLDEGDGSVACIPVGDIKLVVVAAARRCAQEGERMATLATQVGRADLLGSLTTGIEIRRAPAPRPRVTDAPMGVVAHARADQVNLGAAPLLGRTSPAALRSVAALVEDTNARVRCTPWRGIVVLGIAGTDQATAIAALARVGFSSDPTDPAHLVSACVGLPGCASSRADTGRAARALLDAPGPLNGRIHLSGCEKRCGANAERVVVAADDGTFEIGAP
ncbi:MAG: precorrin-3B synthase [Acidimicrobiia bacterium]|nr:precorrin-3B synthase [Acidimicrobiia bacterium]